MSITSSIPVKPTIAIIFVLLALIVTPAVAFNDVNEISEIYNKRKKQTILEGTIDSLIIKRDNVEILLGSGEVTMFDFGADKSSMVFYKGKGRFKYFPPNDIEKKNLIIMGGIEIIDEEFKDISFIMVPEDISAIDTSSLKRVKIKEADWRRVTRFNDELAEYLGFNPHIRIFGEILSGEPSSCFLARFDIDDIGKLVYCEDPLCDDYNRIYRCTEKDKAPDIIAAYSPDGLTPSQRGYYSLDIINYDIAGKINGIGKIESECGIQFRLLRGGQQFIYFNLSRELNINSVRDSSGEDLIFIQWDKSPGFGIWMNQPLQIGETYRLNVAYEGRPFDYIWDIYFANERNPWYPFNNNYDKTGVTINLVYPDEFEMVFGGVKAEIIEASREGSLKWSIKGEVSNIPLCFGPMLWGNFLTKDSVTINIYAPRLYDWVHKTDAMARHRDVVVNVFLNVLADYDWFDKSYEELNKQFYIYQNLVEQKDFDIICAVESPFEYRIGSAGIIPLTTTFKDNFRYRDEYARAHELAHLWWGHAVDIGKPDDIWIVEGLAEYFSFIANIDPYDQYDKAGRKLSSWRDSILVANVDGLPITMGMRLNNSVYDHYTNLLVAKSAYIFHMIRYMLYDFNQDSDRYFIKFLRDIYNNNKWGSITVAEVRETLETYAGSDMDWFFQQWIQGTEIPAYQASFDFPETNDSTFSVILNVKQNKVSPRFKMIVPVRIDMADDYYVVHKLMIDEPEKQIKIEELPHKPIDVKFNIERAVLCEEIAEAE